VGDVDQAARDEMPLAPTGTHATRQNRVVFVACDQPATGVVNVGCDRSDGIVDQTEAAAPEV
jgi:hypothetical protein